MEITPSWKAVLHKELSKGETMRLLSSAQKAYTTHTVYPALDHVFNAFALCPFEQIKVVIIGQDPYHGPDQAHGLSFSVPVGAPIPPSLRNIYKELQADIGKEIPATGNLEHWATQGVLLLNSSLTVEAGKPGSHRKLGWERFTDVVIQKISDEREHVVFLLWGRHAQAKGVHIDRTKHLVLKAPHPSPLSAYNGWFGCKHFSQTNEYLMKYNQTPIEW